MRIFHHSPTVRSSAVRASFSCSLLLCISADGCHSSMQQLEILLLMPFINSTIRDIPFLNSIVSRWNTGQQRCLHHVPCTRFRLHSVRHQSAFPFSSCNSSSAQNSTGRMTFQTAWQPQCLLRMSNWLSVPGRWMKVTKFEAVASRTR